MKFWENLAYSFNARDSFANNTPIRGAGLRKNDDQSRADKASKFEFRASAKRLLNLPLDMPDPSGAGGNTGTFFHPNIYKFIGLTLIDNNQNIQFGSH